MKKHGMSGTKIYRAWADMKYRCNNPKCHAYPQYGGRNINVCADWNNSFEVFYEWAMANGYADNLSLDRRDNDKGYTPENCRWVSMLVQSNNQSNHHKYLSITLKDCPNVIMNFNSTYQAERVLKSIGIQNVPAAKRFSDFTNGRKFNRFCTAQWNEYPDKSDIPMLHGEG